MKKSSQLLSLVLALFLCTNSSCKKEAAYMNDAIITGFDMRACICCGGLMITFNGEPGPYSGDFELITNVADLEMEYKEKFPVYVKVDWEYDTTKVCRRIIVNRIARR